MKKDIMNEKGAHAFRNYARMGLTSSRSMLEIISKIRGMCRDCTALDMLAVFDTLRLLEFLGDDIALRAVSDIYFATAQKKPEANQITFRIRRLADEMHCDDRTVYRRLKRARDLWAYIREKEKKQTAGKRGLLTRLIT